MKILLDAGANPNVQDKFGVTPLYIAASIGSAECVRLLLQKGADPTLARQLLGRGPQTPLAVATLRCAQAEQVNAWLSDPKLRVKRVDSPRDFPRDLSPHPPLGSDVLPPPLVQESVPLEKRVTRAISFLPVVGSLDVDLLWQAYKTALPRTPLPFEPDFVQCVSLLQRTLVLPT